MDYDNSSDDYSSSEDENEEIKMIEENLARFGHWPVNHLPGEPVNEAPLREMEDNESSDDEDMMSMEGGLMREEDQHVPEPNNDAYREMEDNDRGSDDYSSSDSEDDQAIMMIEEEMARYGNHRMAEPVNEANSVESIFEKCTGPTTMSTEECRICTKEAEHPIGCTMCNKLVGCLLCCKQWAQSSMERAGKPTCPLCRNEWTSSASVEEVAAGSK